MKEGGEWATTLLKDALEQLESLTQEKMLMIAKKWS